MDEWSKKDANQSFACPGFYAVERGSIVIRDHILYEVEDPTYYCICKRYEYLWIPCGQYHDGVLNSIPLPLPQKKQNKKTLVFKKNRK
jgi:hypothetical protein